MGQILQNPVILTTREIEVMQVIRTGLSSKEAAKKLCCCKRTIDFHLANIYKKLGANNRTQAINAAVKLGLI